MEISRNDIILMARECGLYGMDEDEEYIKSLIHFAKLILNNNDIETRIEAFNISSNIKI